MGHPKQPKVHHVAAVMCARNAAAVMCAGKHALLRWRTLRAHYASSVRNFVQISVPRNAGRQCLCSYAFVRHFSDVCKEEVHPLVCRLRNRLLHGFYHLLIFVSSFQLRRLSNVDEANSDVVAGFIVLTSMFPDPILFRKSGHEMSWRTGMA